MLITEEWSSPKRIENSRNVLLRFSQGGFSVRINSANGGLYEVHIPDGKEYEIRAAEISHLSHPQISFRTHGKQEIHVRVEDPIN